MMKATVFIQDVYTITGIGIVPVGQVKSGVFRVGMKSNIGGKVMEVKSIEMHHQQLTEANVGDNIGFNLKNGDKNLIQAVCRTEVEFSDEQGSTPVAQTSASPEASALQNSQVPESHPEPIKPEGFLDSLKRIFGRKK